MMQISSPPPPDVVAMVSAGLAKENEVASVARYDFAMAEREGGNVLGAITASVSFSILFINNIWVVPQGRARGVGRALVDAAEAQGLIHGARTACVDTLTTQAPGFYARLGYREFGRLEGWVDGKPVDRIWFKRSL